LVDPGAPPLGAPDPELRDRRWVLAGVAGGAVAVVSIPLAAAGGAPYLSLDSISPWLVTYAIGLFVALFAVPFLIRERLGDSLASDASWERALLWWGAVALAVLALGAICGLAGDFGSDSLAGSFGLVAAAEAVLVLVTLGAWVVSS
jgi:hypothetical protein